MYIKGETNGLSSRGKKPHERGIVFRDFDVSRLVSDINQASINCKLFIDITTITCSKWRTSRTWSVLSLVIVASRSRRGCARWRTGLLRYLHHHDLYHDHHLHDHHDQYHRHHHHYRDGGLGCLGIHIVVIIRIIFNNLIKAGDMIVKLAALLCIILCLEY